MECGCFGCRHGSALFDQGPNGRMLVRCASEQEPDGVLQGYDTFVVEEKYEDCPCSVPSKDKQLLEIAAQKAAIFLSAEKEGKLLP